ncbi:helix-turn-helix transcriptional regulator [Paenibacillus filicis]|uniref:Helix-turn-helix transcriptional regulator n=1 Tax=Paenibacillus filicis TaxID=669464 RepID=A0ABU9DLJ1_9BACL
MFSYKPLWRILVEKEMTRTEMREALGLSSSTLAKMGKGEYVSLEVIDKLCTYFEVQPNYIIEHQKEKEG